MPVVFSTSTESIEQYRKIIGALELKINGQRSQLKNLNKSLVHEKKLRMKLMKELIGTKSEIRKLKSDNRDKENKIIMKLEKDNSLLLLKLRKWKMFFDEAMKAKEELKKVKGKQDENN